MKEGPFKSTTHGPIPVSMKARELLLANQTAIQDAVRDGDYNSRGQAVARSRGDLAKYLSELEAADRDRGLPVRASIYPDNSLSSVGVAFTQRPFWLRIDYEHGRPSKTKHGYEDARRERDVILQQIKA